MNLTFDFDKKKFRVSGFGLKKFITDYSLVITKTPVGEQYDYMVFFEDSEGYII